MRIPILLMLFVLSLNVNGQAVNESITLQLSQPRMLRVDAGGDLNLSESGSVTIGETIYVNGGVPEFSYRWDDAYSGVYYEKTPEVSQPGPYRVTVTDINNCSAADSLTVRDYGTGNTPYHGEPVEIVTADRVSRRVHVELKGIESKFSLSVMTLDGKVIHSYAGTGTRDGWIHTVDLSHVEQGIFLLTIRYSESQSVHKFFLQ